MHVLLIEDNPIDVQVLRERLAESGGDVTLHHYASLGELSFGIPKHVDIVLLDLGLPDGNGIESVRRVQTLAPEVPVVILTGDDDERRSLQMVRHGAQDYLVKGKLTADGLWRSLRYAVERHELKRRLTHADRLAVVGELAAGVAHEVANPATWVLGKLQLLRRRLDNDVHRDELPLLDDCLSGLERISQVVRELQGYAKLGDTEIEEVHLDQLVARTCSLVDPSVRHRARLLTELEPLPALAVDRSKLEQLLTNLLMNAAYAIGEGSANDNRITVRTWQDSESVYVSVEDTGEGISEEVRPRIFEPFFTTKPRDQGTGLGLAISAEIVRQHRGEISCESAPGGGTLFCVRLPMNTGLSPTSSPPRPRESEQPAPRGRVLLIDDEAQLRDVYRELIGDHHDIEVAADGNEGLKLLLEAGDFDVVVCDLMMPGCDGPSFYQQVCMRAPELQSRIIFCSGGVVTERVRRFVSSIDNLLLHKPVPLADLLKAINSVLALEK